MKIIVIAAAAENGVMGDSKTNTLPWQYPQDLKHFKEQTANTCIVMGRNTRESLPPKAWARMSAEAEDGTPRVIIVSSTMDADDPLRDDAMLCRSFTEACEVNATDLKWPTMHVIGGVRLFTEALRVADELSLTLIHAKHEGDVFFPGGDMWFHGDAVASAHLGAATPSEWWFECVSRNVCAESAVLTFTTWKRLR